MLHHRLAVIEISALDPNALAFYDLPLAEASVEGLQSEPNHCLRACYRAKDGRPVYHFEGAGLFYLSWRTEAYVVRQHLEPEGVAAYLELESLEGSVRLVRRALLEADTQPAWVYWDSASRLDYWQDEAGFWQIEGKDTTDSKVCSDLAEVNSQLANNNYEWVKYDERIDLEGAHWSFKDGRHSERFSSLEAAARYLERLEVTEEAPPISLWKTALLGALSLSATPLFQRGAQALWGSEIYPTTVPTASPVAHPAPGSSRFGWGFQMLGKLVTLSPLVRRAPGTARGLGALFNLWLWSGAEGVTAHTEPQVQRVEKALVQELEVLLGEKASIEPALATGTHFAHWQQVLREAQGMEKVGRDLEATFAVSRQADMRRLESAALKASVVLTEAGTSDFSSNPPVHTASKSLLKATAPLLALDLEVDENAPEIQVLHIILIQRVTALLNEKIAQIRVKISQESLRLKAEAVAHGDSLAGFSSELIVGPIFAETIRLNNQVQHMKEFLEKLPQKFSSTSLCRLVNEADEEFRRGLLMSLIDVPNSSHELIEMIFQQVNSVRRAIGLEPAEPEETPAVMLDSVEPPVKRVKVSDSGAQVTGPLLQIARHEEMPIRYAAAIMPDSPCRGEALAAFHHRLLQLNAKNSDATISSAFLGNAAGITIHASHTVTKEVTELTKTAISEDGFHSEPLALELLFIDLAKKGIIGEDGPIKYTIPGTEKVAYKQQWLSRNQSLVTPTLEQKRSMQKDWKNFFIPYKITFQAALNKGVIYSERGACLDCSISISWLFGNKYQFFYSVLPTREAKRGLQVQFAEAIVLGAYMNYFDLNYNTDEFPGLEYGQELVDSDSTQTIHGNIQIFDNRSERIKHALFEEIKKENQEGWLELYCSTNYVVDFFNNIRAIQKKRNSLFWDDVLLAPNGGVISANAAETEACLKLYKSYTQENQFTFLYNAIREYPAKPLPAFPSSEPEQPGTKCQLSLLEAASAKMSDCTPRMIRKQ